MTKTIKLKSNEEVTNIWAMTLVLCILTANRNYWRGTYFLHHIYIMLFKIIIPLFFYVLAHLIFYLNFFPNRGPFLFLESSVPSQALAQKNNDIQKSTAKNIRILSRILENSSWKPVENPNSFSFTNYSSNINRKKSRKITKI